MDGWMYLVVLVTVVGVQDVAGGDAAILGELVELTAGVLALAIPAGESTVAEVLVDGLVEKQGGEEDELSSEEERSSNGDDGETHVW